MKKICSLVLIIILCMLSFSCGNNVETHDQESSEAYEEATENQDISLEEALRAIAAKALYDALTERYSGSKYDIGKTRVSYGSIEEKSFGWLVYGTYTLYDKYGEIDTNHYDEQFVVSVSSDGDSDCTLN